MKRKEKFLLLITLFGILLRSIHIFVLFSVPVMLDEALTYLEKRAVSLTICFIFEFFYRVLLIAEGNGLQI